MNTKMPHLGPIVVLLVTGVTGCGWQRKVTFESPSKRFGLEVYQPPLLNEAGLRVDLTTDKKERVTIFRVRHEVIMEFAHAYWSADESVVGFLACGSGPIEFAYDLAHHQTLPFDRVAAKVQESILRSYPPSSVQAKVTSPFSPCDVGAFVPEYQRRYPRGRTD